MFLSSKKDDKFFTLFLQSTELACKAAKRLEELATQDAISASDAQEMNILENEADAINTQIIDRMNTTFITPLDREDIYDLAQILDDVVDSMEGTVERMLLYRTGKPSVTTLEMTRLIVSATEQIQLGFSCLSNIRFKKAEILAATEKIYHIENNGDKLYQQEVARLFECEKNPIEIIKWKEILELLETTLDQCETIADHLKGVVLKYD